MSVNAMSSGQARSIKLTGDRLRSFFRKQCTNDDGRIKKEFLVGLSNQYSEGSFVLKSGSNWQFHLGSFSPYTENWGAQYLNLGKTIKYSETDEQIISDLRSDAFLRSFILKGNFFCIYDSPSWLIFDSEDIILMLQDSNQVVWRVLDSGRIKGDICLSGVKRTIFTLEYRAEDHKRQFVLGAHGGGAGNRLKNILKSKLFFNTIPVDYEFWLENP
jgi:hypothetical protein